MMFKIVETWREKPVTVICRFLFFFGAIMIVGGVIALFGGTYAYLKLTIGIYAWLIVFVLALCHMAAP